MILLVVFLAGLFVGAAATALLLDMEWWTGGPKDPAWWIDPDEPEPYAASVPRLLPGEDSRSECEFCSHRDHYPEPCDEIVPWGPGDSRPCDCHDRIHDARRDGYPLDPWSEATDPRRGPRDDVPGGFATADLPPGGADDYL